ncbi:MAG: glycosyltransferase family 39 protein [Anaerolineaceae bacterium]|nr:glycosyltransferase family 39 protein [Anaerolineaceae bacterium]
MPIASRSTDENSHARRAGWILLAGVLLLVIAASRVTRIAEMTMNRDEVWSAWQSFGSPEEIVRWTPYDWPPLYYLTLAGWRELVGPQPVALRYLSNLVFLLGAASLYRVGRRLRGEVAGIVAALAYAALGYAILLSIEVRGYALLMGLGPLALWLTLRYFDHPGWRRGLPLAVVLAAMFYTNVTSAVAGLVLCLATLVIYRRRVWRWWLPGGVAALLALPEIVNKAGLGVSRVAGTQTLTPPPLPEALANLLWRYAGNAVTVWALLLVAITVWTLVRQRGWQRQTVALLLWVGLMPLVMYLLNPLLGFFGARYSWWWMMGAALWVGWGAVYLRREVITGLVALLVALAFVPVPTVGEYNIFGEHSPLGENFAWLTEHMQVGDVFLLDPSQACGATEEWDYYTRVYFPNGLRFVAAPGDEPRIWYVAFDGRQDAATQAALSADYVRDVFVGPPGCLFQLYQGPPDRAGVLFSNGMRFHGAEVLENGVPRTGPLVWHEGETVTLRLWWSAGEPVDLDYSVTTILLNKGGVQVDGFDGPPQVLDAPQATSQWQPGRYYTEERRFTLPYPSGSGGYRVYLAVYFWEDAIRLDAPGVDENGLLYLLSLPVRAY